MGWVKMRRTAMPAVALVAMAGLLSGCGGLGKAPGLARTEPDEFKVIARAPLEVPPDYNLRPPQPGSPRPQELERDTRFTQTVFGAAGSTAGLVDPRISARQTEGEAALLAQAGANFANPEIRAIVDRENPGVVVGDKSFLERLLFWRDDQAPQVDGPVPTIGRTGSTTTNVPAGSIPAGTAQPVEPTPDSAPRPPVERGNPKF